MPRRQIVARGPTGKVTTINILLGEKGVPFGWEYVFCEQAEIPHTNKLADHWLELSKGKTINTSTSNKDSVSVQEVNKEQKAVTNRIASMYRARNNLLQDLDIEFIRALEDKKEKKKRTAIIKFKNDLRNFNISADEFFNPKEILDYWPPLLLHRSEDYMIPKKPINKWLIVFTVIFLMLAAVTPFIIILL